MIRNYFKEVMAMTDVLWVTLVGGLIAFLQALILANLKAVNKKVTDMCADNTKEHDELYAAKNKIENRVQAIETMHHIKGCDVPK